MNTPAHLILGAAVFSKPRQVAVTVAALCGSLAPDLSLYVMAGWSIFIADIPAETVFRQLYYSPEWQGIFAIDNSFVLWGIALAVALWARATTVAVFCGAALLHLAFDFPLHNHDARMHFWPLTDWVFISPLSYWDSRHYGGVIGPLEIILSLVACIVLWRRHYGTASRCAIAVAATAQIAPAFIWAWVFATSNG